MTLIISEKDSEVMRGTRREDYGGDSVAHQTLWLNKAACPALADELWTEVTPGTSSGDQDTRPKQSALLSHYM